MVRNCPKPNQPNNFLIKLSKVKNKISLTVNAQFMKKLVSCPNFEGVDS